MGWRRPATPRACPAPGTTISLSALPGSAFSCSRLPELRATALPLARALFRAVAQLAAACRDLRVRSQVWGRAKWVCSCRICGNCGLCGGPGMVLAAPGAACAIRGAKRPHASRKGGALGAGARTRVWLRAICILKQFIVPCMCNRASCTRSFWVCAVRRLLGFVRPLEPANVAGSHHRARVCAWVSVWFSTHRVSLWQRFRGCLLRRPARMPARTCGHAPVREGSARLSRGQRLRSQR